MYAGDLVKLRSFLVGGLKVKNKKSKIKSDPRVLSSGQAMNWEE